MILALFQDVVIFKKQPTTSPSRDLWKQVLLKKKIKRARLAALWPDRAVCVRKTQCLLSSPQLIRGPVWQWMALTINTSWKISNRVRGNGKKMRCSYRETISDVSSLKGCFFFFLPNVAEGWAAESKISPNLNTRYIIICVKFNSVDIPLRCCYQKVAGCGTQWQSTPKFQYVSL